MALAKYDLPTKPTNIGKFCLGFLGICRQEAISAKDVGSTGALLPSKLADLAIYLTKVYRQQISANFCREMLANLATFENDQLSGFRREMLANLGITNNYDIYSL